MAQYSSIKYKAISPEQTISHARSILAEFDLSVREYQWYCNPEAMSVRLNLVEFQFGVNGKGINRKYALASAYGELLERIQNISFFNSVFHSGNTNSIALKYPDQTDHLYYMDDLDCYYLKHMFSDRESKQEFVQKGAHVSIPFYSVFRNETVYVPERVLRDTTGTNGMCAGNTAAEAIIQGICEIFERYVLKKILCNHEEPPEIPLEYVGPDIIERYVVPMEKLGYQVYLKDCTLNGRFPVAGIFIRQSNQGLFHLGAAPDMWIALERCFTELLQGETASGLRTSLQPILSDSNAKTRQFWQQEFCHAFKNYKSAQKSSMFRNLTRMNKDHIFVSNDLTSVMTMSSLLHRVEKLGYDFLIRDNTFLGFPAFHIFIPNLSELRLLNLSLLNIHDRVQKARHIFFNLDIAKKKDLIFMIDVIDELSSRTDVEKMEVMKTIHNIPAAQNSTLFFLDYRWFLSTIHFHLGNYIKAKYLLDELINELETSLRNIPQFYYCMRDILKLLLDNVCWNEINYMITDRYIEKDMIYAYYPLVKIENLPLYFNIPRCEKCINCTYKDCKAKTLDHYSGTFQALIKENMQQDTIKELMIGLKEN